MLKLQLHLTGKTKSFSQDFISGRMFRKALELDDKRNNYLKSMLDQETPSPVEEQEELINQLYQFISDVFGGQFTAEQYEDGTDARRIVDQSWMIVHGIISQVTDPLKAVESDDDDPTKKKKKSK